MSLVNKGGIQGASMAKVAKMAKVSSGTIYLYFNNKQDLVNRLYLDLRESFAKHAFNGYDVDYCIKDSFEKIWFNMTDFKLNQKEKASFLSQCDNTPMVDEQTRQEGLKHLAPLFELWDKGKQEGILKQMSPYLMYAFTIYPIAFLINMDNRNLCSLCDITIKGAFDAA